MNNIIKLYEISTYPKEVIDKFENYNEDCYFEEDFNILEEYYIECVHVTRIKDISTIEKYGLLRPFVKKRKPYISQKLKKIILRPYKKHLNMVKFKKLKKEYDKCLIKEYNKEATSEIEGWYGKFSNICFTFDNLKEVKIDKDEGYKNLIEQY